MLMWLLLVHQIPPDPAYLRVKVRRRLRRMGAAALKSTVYVLPQSEPAREGFEWLAREIRADGGEAVLCEARLIGGMTDEDVRNLFRTDRDAEYAEVAREAEKVGTEAGGDDGRARLSRARRRLASAVELDFFEARGRVRAERALREAEARLAGPPVSASEPSTPELHELRGRVWVTRRGVHVDRMASAWLIRRFVDPDACFRFVDPEGYAPGPEEIRYDMYDAEFTHEGDRCTFEVLAARVAPGDPSLAALGEIVHDIDLGDGKFGRPEASGIERLVEGIRTARPEDEERLSRAAEIFESLYRSFGGAG
jgi:hypothetical protein